jgi:glutathione S-transferase
VTQRIVWGRRNSSNVQKVLWALTEMGMDFEVRRVGGGFGGTRDPAYLAMNPNAVVPTLQDGALTLFESDAIVRYLARRYGAGGLWPEDPAQAALADQWTTWNTSTFYPAVAALFFPTVRTPRAEQKPDGLGPQTEAMARAVAMLDAALQGREWLVGDAFSFGEIGLAISLNRALKLPVGAPDPGPATRAWLARVSERRGFREHVDQPVGTCLEEWREIEERLG